MSLCGKAALVTGAGSGIGRAVARALLGAGARVCLAGRHAGVLAETAQASPRAMLEPADLSCEADIPALAAAVGHRLGRLDVLVHCAGVHLRDEGPGIADLADMHRVNAQAPLALTRAVLPLLAIAEGEVVFVNSTILAAEPAGQSHYRDSKRALQSGADALRSEVHPAGVRVLSIYAGSTATPMQERIFAEEGRTYPADRLMQPEDVAHCILAAIQLPRTAEITDLTVRPMRLTSPEAPTLR
jgi:NAD(P)-dependent dehydrogenase (short-subunit alcohol dehydrogenase family)